MKPFLKHAGAKFSELEKFQKYFPKNINTLYESFVGGGSVFLNTVAKSYVLNDFDNKVISFWNSINNHYGSFFRMKDVINTLNHDKSVNNVSLQILVQELMDNTLELSDDKLKNKLIKKYSLGDKTKNNAINLVKNYRMEQFYYFMRDLYNRVEYEIDTIPTFFVKEYAFQSMDRINGKGDFNVPYGGHSYTNKDLSKKLGDIESFIDRTSKIPHKFVCQDFKEFLTNQDYKEDDFIFLDPPYLTTFSTYAGNVFNVNHHTELRDILKNIKCKFLMVINYDETTNSLYMGNEFVRTFYHKRYKVNFRNRCESETTHMIVTNYDL